MDDEGVAVAAEIGGHTVNLGDADASAAHRGRFHRKDPAGPARQPQHGGVRVGRAQLDRVDAELHTLLSGQPEAVRQAGIIRAEAQQTCHQCAVGAVASACRGKAAIQTDVGIHQDIAQQLFVPCIQFWLHPPCGWKRARS